MKAIFLINHKNSLKSNFIMRTRIFYFTVLICLLSGSVFPQGKNLVQKKSNPLIGNWTTNVLKEHKTKVTMSFDKNGNVEYNVAVPLKGTYLSRGDKLITMFNNPRSGLTEIDTSVVKIKGDTLYQINRSGMRETAIKSVRIKSGVGIIGTWISENYNGYHARQEFTPYNSIFVDLIVKSIKGSYSINGDNFTITSKDNPPMRIQFSINDKKDVLTISRPAFKEQLELIRVKGK